MAELVESVLWIQLDGLKPTLTRYGHRHMIEQLDAKAWEIRALLNNQFEAKRTAELRDRMLAAGLPT